MHHPRQYSGYEQPGYDQGYGGYDQGYGGYDQGGYDQNGYGAYGGSVPVPGAAASPAGMTMVPMMLPSGQVTSPTQNTHPPPLL
jgi:hypothetical protein